MPNRCPTAPFQARRFDFRALLVLRSVAFVGCVTGAVPAFADSSGEASSASSALGDSKPPAPGDAAEPDSSEGAGALLLAPALLDLSSINERLRSSGYEELPSVATLVGVEGVGVFEGGFVIGARVGGFLQPASAGPDDTHTDFGGGFGTLDVGFALVRTTPFQLALTAGMGWYVVSLDVSDDQQARFDDVLADPKRGASLKYGGILGSLTLAMDWRIGRGDGSDRTFFTLGTRIGGLYGPPAGDWGLASNARASGGPNFALAGGFIALALGFGAGPARSATAVAVAR